MTYYVYIMTNRSRVVLYTGITNSLQRRLWFHANTSPASFTRRYKIDRLVYYEDFDNPADAIAREKEIKHWRREKKNALVRTQNPRWERSAERTVRRKLTTSALPPARRLPS